MKHRAAYILILALLAACGSDDGAQRPIGGEELGEAPAQPAGGDAPLEAEELPLGVDGLGAVPGEGALPGTADPQGIGPVATAPGGAAGGAAGSPGTAQTAPAPGQPGSSPAGGATTAPPVGTEATDVLRRAEQVYAQVRSMEADFVQRVDVPLLETTQHSRGRIYHQRPDRFAMRFTDPQGDLIVADGRFLWMYYPSTDAVQVMQSPMAEGGQTYDLYAEFLSDATSRYNATRTGSEVVGGRQTHALTLVPRGPSSYQRIRIWVDAEDSLVRRFEIVEENDSVRRLELSNIRLNPSIQESVFRFTPPPGTQVYRP